MRSPITSSALLLVFAVQSALVQVHGFDFDSFKLQDTITRDVAIIGGGSAGTYSAISLKDKGKSVIVIEKKGRMGGHTETYIDPATGIPIDMGVIVWHDIPIVRNYFQRLNIPLVKYDFSSLTTMNANIDCRTGKTANVVSPSQEAIGAAFAKYAQFLAQYPRLNDGMFLPDPVPDDFLLPFGDFAKKYGIEDAIKTMYNFNPGNGNFLTLPAIENIRAWGLSLVQQLQTGFVITATHNNSELYTAATSELLAAQSLLLNSEVVATQRSNNGIKLVVSTPSGLKLVKSKKLLITIPPKLDILAPFDLSKNETTIFGKLINAGYYTSILKDTGFPDTLNIANLREDTAQNLPVLPAVYTFSSSGAPGLKLAFYGVPRNPVPDPVPDAVVKADILRAIKLIQKANPDKYQQTQPQFVAFSAHTPFYLQARPEDTKAGFYSQMYALQGLRNTYWTGASWRAHDSSDIWRYTEGEVLPGLLAGL